ncbi:hypothetical protein FQR65_LT02302 [Abscondita terminalis]|nr:hypothetical protein FQR65_LT02302 [Abscondita terminalis]
MPKLKIQRIISFSSEDKIHGAANIMSTEPSKKWLCETEGEKCASVVLQLDKASVITGIDIGNEHSAYVEVLVKRSVASNDFKVLLVMSSFMTPMESKKSVNINKVRMFTYNDLQSPERDEKWDYVKIVCTQPFNRHVQYGLSFINLHSIDNESALNNSVNLGKFTLRPQSPNPVAVGSLFARRKEYEGATPLSAAAAIRDASASPSASPKPPKHFPSPKYKDTPKKKTVTETNDNVTKERNRDELLYAKDEEESHEKIDNIIKKRQKELDEKQEKEKKKLTKKEEKVAIKKQNDEKTTPSHSNKRKLNETEVSTKKKAKVKKERPYHRLLEDVTIVISGIQNPERSDIRNKALQLGAKYRGDWDNTCTHLICAFTNTPKFNQVKGKGKIVNRLWIQDCYDGRKKLPWRRYALDAKELGKEESEDEICEEITRSPELETIHTRSNFGDDSDTEDEIERVFSLPKMVSNNFRDMDDTDEETINVNRNKNVKFPELPSVLTSKMMYVDDSFSCEQKKELIRYIVALNGIVSEVPIGIDFMITTPDNVNVLKEICPTAQFVSPKWLWASYNEKKMVPVDISKEKQSPTSNKRGPKRKSQVPTDSNVKRSCLRSNNEKVKAPSTKKLKDKLSKSEEESSDDPFTEDDAEGTILDDSEDDEDFAPAKNNVNVKTQLNGEKDAVFYTSPRVRKPNPKFQDFITSPKVRPNAEKQIKEKIETPKVKTKLKVKITAPIEKDPLDIINMKPIPEGKDEDVVRSFLPVMNKTKVLYDSEEDAVRTVKNGKSKTSNSEVKNVSDEKKTEDVIKPPEKSSEEPKKDAPNDETTLTDLPTAADITTDSITPLITTPPIVSENSENLESAVTVTSKVADTEVDKVTDRKKINNHAVRKYTRTPNEKKRKEFLINLNKKKMLPSDVDFNKLVRTLKSVKLPASNWKIRIVVSRQQTITEVTFTNKEVNERCVKFSRVFTGYVITFGKSVVKLIGAPNKISSFNDVTILLDIIHNLSLDDPILQYVTDKDK